MLNLRMKSIMLIRDVIWMNKTHVEYASIKEGTKETIHILQDEYESYNWGHVKMDTVKIEVKTDNVKT